MNRPESQSPAIQPASAPATAHAARPGRLLVAGLTLALAGLFVALDLLTAERIDPFRVPPPAAFGSGLATAGAHCALPPPPP